MLLANSYSYQYRECQYVTSIFNTIIPNSNTPLIAYQTTASTVLLNT